MAEERLTACRYIRDLSEIYTSRVVERLKRGVLPDKKDLKLLECVWTLMDEMDCPAPRLLKPPKE